jgi:hypothetical protein
MESRHEAVACETIWIMDVLNLTEKSKFES